MNAAEVLPRHPFGSYGDQGCAGPRYYGDQQADGRANIGATVNNIAILSRAPS